MNLTIEATKEIFELLDEDESIGIIAFDDRVEIVEIIKPKKKINEDDLFDHLETIQARGGTNMEIGMEKAIQMLLSDRNTTRNKKIILITDACPNIGLGKGGLKEMAEQAFLDSNKTIGISYIGVGLSFNAEVSEELSRVRGTTISSVNTSRELKKTLVEDFNYLITPIAFDVDFQLKANGYEIENVYGGDDDEKKSNKLLHFRTLTGSAINEKGVKGCAILIKLKDIAKSNEEIDSFLKIEIDYLPSNSDENVHKVFEIGFGNDQNSAIQKAISLALFFDIMKEVLPDYNQYKEKLDEEEKAKLNQLKTFLMIPAEDVKDDLSNEIDIIDRLLII
jgi:Ca-activated chloride channel family protein